MQSSHVHGTSAAGTVEFLRAWRKDTLPVPKAWSLLCWLESMHTLGALDWEYGASPRVLELSSVRGYWVIRVVGVCGGMIIWQNALPQHGGHRIDLDEVELEPQDGVNKAWAVSGVCLPQLIRTLLAASREE